MSALRWSAHVGYLALYTGSALINITLKGKGVKLTKPLAGVQTKFGRRQYTVAHRRVLVTIIKVKEIGCPQV